MKTLKAELAAQREMAREGERLKKQLEESEARVDGLQAKFSELTNALSEAKTEITALSTRLSASRAAEAAANAKVPGRDLKNRPRPTGVPLPVAQMKEDLFGDLTGLIVRDVKRQGAEDMFDCLQTGRNGSRLLLFVPPASFRFIARHWRVYTDKSSKRSILNLSLEMAVLPRTTTISSSRTNPSSTLVATEL
jgi:hypothetical protein